MFSVFSLSVISGQVAQLLVGRSAEDGTGSEVQESYL